MPAERRLRHLHGAELDVRPEVRVARLAAEAWGVVSMEELQACGLSPRAVQGRVRKGQLHRMHRGVYVVGHANAPLEARFLAAVKACGAGAALSHVSAAVHWGLLEWEERWVEVTVCGRGTRVHPRLRVHRTLALDPREVTRRHGIPVTTPVRTIVDCAAVVTEQALRRAVRQARALRLASGAEVAAALDRLGPRRGTRALAGILATGPAPTRSVLEDVVLDLVLAGGFAHPEVNVPLVLDGRRIVPDFRWPQVHLVLEADGAAWHGGELAREADAERQALLEAHGERVIRVSWAQAVGAPRRWRGSARQALRDARPRP